MTYILCEMAKISRVIPIKLKQLVYENIRIMITDMLRKRSHNNRHLSELAPDRREKTFGIMDVERRNDKTVSGEFGRSGLAEAHLTVL